MLFRNLTTSLRETGCQGGQGSPRAVAPSEEEEAIHNEKVWERGCILDLPPPGKESPASTTHSRRGLVDPRVGMDDTGEEALALSELKLLPLGHPAHSQLL
jgi:hypothetical protein